jgi:signal transduction histidine kinase
MGVGAPLRLLVMEDDLGQVQLAQRALQRAGYRVDLAHDGETGLALVGQLAAGLAHEIGTPLNVIAGNAERPRTGL